MDSEQLRVFRRISAVKKQLGTALSSEGGSVSGGLDVKDKLTAAGGMAVTGGMKVSGQIRAAGAFSAGNGRLVVPSDGAGTLKLTGAVEAGGRLVVPADSASDITIDGHRIWHAGNASQTGVTLFSGSVSTAQNITLTQSFGSFRFLGITLNRASSTSNKMTIMMPVNALSGTTAWVSFYNGTHYYVRIGDASGNIGILTVGADTCVTRIAGFN